MDGVLLEVRSVGGAVAPVLALVAELRQEVATLRGEVAQLRRENLELRQQAGYWKGQHGQALQRLQKLQQEVEQVRGDNRKLQSQVFGRKTEKDASPDRSHHLAGENEPPAEPKFRGQRRGRPGPQRRNHAHLPARVEVHELPEAECRCPDCGLPYTRCGSEDAEQLELETVVYRRVIQRQRYQRTCRCPGPRTVTAPPPPKLIPKGLLGTSLWVEILLDKFASHRPTERLLASWQLLGLNVAAGTVAGGLQQLEPLFTPVYAALQARNREAPYLQADETRWLVFIDTAGKTGHRWWLWVFLGSDTVVFVLDPSRSHTVPETHLPSAGGHVLMVDRYSAYKAIAQVQDGVIVLAFCWAHVRRDFVKVGQGWPELKTWALAWLRRIRDLYRLNRQRRANDQPPAARQQADADLRQAIAAMHTQAAVELADAQLREPCRKVLHSLQEHWTGLTRFVEDPRIPMDNNASERQVRGPALGRKNYYGSGALWSGHLAAMLFSLFATLAKWNLNPRDWLTWYLQTCAEAGGTAPQDITPFLPWNLSAEQRATLTTRPPVPPPNTS
jgi:transposase